MTTGDFMPETSECCGDAAVYLLGALAPAEAERFGRHAETCALCQDELGALRHVVDALPMTAPQHRAPRALRRRVMRQVRSESALKTQAARRQGLFGFARGRSSARAALVGALAGAAALAIAGGIELTSSGSSVRVVRASVAAAQGSAQLRISGGHAELVVSHLPPPPRGRIYELWIKRGTRPPSPTRALFSVTASGAADVGVPGSVGGASAIMVTAEPAGGSRVPTRAPVIVAYLA
jgi:anti-sigma-K factor RskA